MAAICSRWIDWSAIRLIFFWFAFRWSTNPCKIVLTANTKAKLVPISKPFAKATGNIIIKLQLVVDVFTALSSAVEFATDKLELFGTAAVVVFGTQLIKSVGGAEIRGLLTAPTYTLVVTRNELAA